MPSTFVMIASSSACPLSRERAEITAMEQPPERVVARRALFAVAEDVDRREVEMLPVVSRQILERRIEIRGRRRFSSGGSSVSCRVSRMSWRRMKMPCEAQPVAR